MPNTLVILPHNPGDVVMGLHVLSRLHSAYPDTAIDFVVGDECSEVITNHPHLRRVYVLPTKQLNSLWQKADSLEMDQVTRSFIQDIRSEKYDLTINLFQDHFGALLHGLIPSKKKIGFSFENNTQYQVLNRYMEHLFAVPVARHQNPWHVVDIFLRSLGVTHHQRSKSILPSPAQSSQPVGQNAAVFQIGSAWPGKRWPLKHWARLVEMIAPRFNTLFFTGAAEELPLFREFEQFLSPHLRETKPLRIQNLVGKTTLLQTASIISQAELLVTGDTVAMHMGAATGTRTIALFGASNPVETGPYGSGHFIIQSSTEAQESLPLRESNPNLERIEPEPVAEFIINGQIPRDLFIWETSWDNDLKMQVLKNHRQEFHPFQKNVAAMEKALLPEIRHSAPDQLMGSTIQRVSQQLDKCLLHQSRENLLAIDTLDKELAQETRESIIWEAYRIAVNGLPLHDTRLYLQKRKQRLIQSYYEYSALESG